MSDLHRFEFDLDRGIREQVVEALEASPILAFTDGVGPRESGVYALYRRGDLVYIGKASRGMTTSRRTLRARLAEHTKKLGSRQGIELSEMQLRYLTFDSEWWVWAAELALIQNYQKPTWNGSGFGSKDQGKNRRSKPSPWDGWFPPK